MGKKFLPQLHHYSFDIDKRWCVEYVDTQGKRKRKYIPKCDSLKERKVLAQQILKEVEILANMDCSKSIQDSILLEVEKRKDSWRVKTYQCKMSKINAFLRFMKAKEWTEENVSKFFLSLKLNPSTYNDYMRHIRQALVWCDLDHLMSKVDKRNINPVPACYFTESQRKMLVKAMEQENPELLFFVQFVYYCFLRPRSELRLLKVGDVILEEKKIVVPGPISKNKKQQYIAIPDAFYPVLVEKLKNRMPTEYLFYFKDKYKPVGYNTLGRQHRELLESLNFDTERYKMYSWKHTGAVASVRAGIHIKQLQIQLRHHSLDQVDAYLRQLGVSDLGNLQKLFPEM